MLGTCHLYPPQTWQKKSCKLVGKGGKYIAANFYDPCVLDLANAMLQGAKMFAFMEGRYKGVGPSAKKLGRQVGQGKMIVASIAREVGQTI